MNPSHIFVTAAPGRTVPIHPDHASAPGGVLLMCVEGKIYRVPYNGTIRRSINRGDLIPCTRDGKVELKEHRDAHAPEAVELDETGAIAGATVTTAPEVHLTPALAETAAKFDTTDAANALPTKGA